MTDRKRIAFIRPGAWPLANREVEVQLRKQFPDHEVDVIDIRPLVMKHPSIVLINAFYTLILYGIGILRGDKRIKEAFWRTPYIFHAVKRVIGKQLIKSHYVFTFQMQSMFDCSGLVEPHFVYTDHTHLANLRYAGFDRKKLFAPSWIELENQIYANATLTFLRSSNIRQSLIEQYHYPAERAICVYAGNNVSVLANTARPKDYTDKKILFVGIDWSRKGGQELVEAFQNVSAEHPDASLTIVGANPRVKVPNCTIVGRIPPVEVARYYSEATIFCLPTHIEPFGIAFLEAMQAKLPIVGTNVGAIPDFVKDGWNGYLVEPGDVQGISQALMKLLNDPGRRREFGERGLALANERYTWDSVGKRMHQHICENLH